MKVRMRVQAGAEPVDERDRTQVQAGGVCFGSTVTVGLQALLYHLQKDAQCGIECTLVAL